MTTETRRVTATVRDRIRGGVYHPRGRIPSQAEMAEEFGVSGRTVALAIATLRSRGYLWTLPHKGSFVRPSDDWTDPEFEPGSR